jgi:hypothetical protein
MLASFGFREGVGFAGQGRQGGGDLGERGAHVRRSGAARVARAVGVPGVGVGDGEPEVALTQVKVVWLVFAIYVFAVIRVAIGLARSWHAFVIRVAVRVWRFGGLGVMGIT